MTTAHPPAARPAPSSVARPPREARFWNRIADRYSRSPVADPEAYNRKLDRTRDLLRPDMRVLEVGCGTGSTALALAPHAAEIHATDISEQMIAIARSKAERAEIGTVRFSVLGLDDLDPADGPYDMVLAHNLLHLVPRWRDALVTLRGLLKPGGLYVSTTACLGDDYAWMRPFVPIGRALGFMPRVAFFRQTALEAAMEAAGFAIQEGWKPGKRSGLFLIAEATEDRG